jgi:DNA repair exonuclease SbcCD ATPase subunit
MTALATDDAAGEQQGAHGVSTEASGTVRPRPSRRLRVLIGALIVLVLALGASAGIGAYLAHTNTQRADRWQLRAQRLERNADALNALLIKRTGLLNARAAQLNQMAAKVRQSTQALSRSEGDVQNLEARQRALANEKAQLEDERAALEQEQVSLSQVAADYVRCSSDLKDALAAVVNQDSSWLDLNGATVQSDCDQADSSLQDFQSTYGGG